MLQLYTILFFTHYNPLLAQTHTPSTNLKIVGAVLYRDNANFSWKAAPNVQVVVKNSNTSQISTYQTDQTGNFKTENILPNTVYFIYANLNGIASKIDTIVTNPMQYVYHATLQIEKEKIYPHLVSTTSTQSPTIAHLPVQVPKNNPTQMEIDAKEQLKKQYLQQVDSVNEIIYKLEVGSFVEPLNERSLFLLPIIETVKAEKKSNGWTRYIVGNYTNIQEAFKKQGDLLIKGYKDTQVIMYVNNIPFELPLDEALEFLEELKRTHQK